MEGASPGCGSFGGEKHASEAYFGGGKLGGSLGVGCHLADAHGNRSRSNQYDGIQ